MTSSLTERGGQAREALLAEPVDWRFKGFPLADRQVTIGTIPQQGWNALRGDLLLPIMLLKDSALSHNIALMADFCREQGVSLAPHGKTAMAPQILERQIEAGAWGVTAATVNQAQVYRTFGTRRILLANELIQPEAIQWVIDALRQDPDFEFFSLVDSPQAVRAIAGVLESMPPPRPLRVLLELGFSGGRTGCRALDDVLATARAVQRVSGLELAGIESYEGIIEAESMEARIAAVDAFLQKMSGVARRLYKDGAFAGQEEIVLSAGGSAFFDQVADRLSDALDVPVPVRVILRSGCYVTHDSGAYDFLSPFGQRGPIGRRLEPALELWSVVVSRPEPGLAISGFGKRDAPYDMGLPIPFAVRRPGSTRDIRGQATVTAMNDQHAYIRLEPGFDLAVGDLLACGISHPCTAFDKWQLLPLVDDDYNVIGGIRTFF